MRGTFNQCELSKAIDGGTGRMVTWIPSRIAHVGAVVRLKDPDNGKWTDGWKVESVAQPPFEEKFLVERSRDYRRQRNGSDI